MPSGCQAQLKTHLFQEEFLKGHEKKLPDG